jgi:hypothetical protein
VLFEKALDEILGVLGRVAPAIEQSRRPRRWRASSANMSEARGERTGIVAWGHNDRRVEAHAAVIMSP